MASIDLLSFAASFLVAISLYSYVAQALVQFLPISHGFANAIGFFIVAVAFELLSNFVLKKLISKITFLNPLIALLNPARLASKLFGTIPGFFSGLILCAFVLSLIIALPFSLFLKNSILSSRIGNVLIANTQGLTKDWNSIFGGAVNDSLSFLTIEPKSNQSVILNFKTKNLRVDAKSAQEMFEDVNSERVSRGIAALSFSDALTNVGIAHCKDMFTRGYFSHYTPEGFSPFDRMAEANISFNFAGENLALAPNVELAMKGLMQSSGHRVNILSTDFHKIGIGVVDGGVYGEMFCQEFTD